MGIYGRTIRTDRELVLHETLCGVCESIEHLLKQTQESSLPRYLESDHFKYFIYFRPARHEERVELLGLKCGSVYDAKMPCAWQGFIGHSGPVFVVQLYYGPSE